MATEMTFALFIGWLSLVFGMILVQVGGGTLRRRLLLWIYFSIGEISGTFGAYADHISAGQSIESVASLLQAFYLAALLWPAATPWLACFLVANQC